MIVNWNTRELTLRCLGSLGSSLGDDPVDVVVVDNASSDGSAAAIVEAHPNVKLVRNGTNLGFAKGVNTALRLVGTEYVVLLNSDATVRLGAVQYLIRQLDAHPDVAMAGGAQVDAGGHFVPTAHRFPCLWHDLATLPGVYDLGTRLLRTNARLARLFFVMDERDVDWLSGAFVACRRSAIDDAGPMPEEFFLYGEDVEWCWRLRQQGWRIRYAGGPGIVHAGGGSAEKLAGDERWLRVLDSLYVFARRHRKPASWRLGWIARSLFLWVRAIRREGVRAVTGRVGNDPAAAMLVRGARRCWAQAIGHPDTDLDLSAAPSRPSPAPEGAR